MAQLAHQTPDATSSSLSPTNTQDPPVSRCPIHCPTSDRTHHAPRACARDGTGSPALSVLARTTTQPRVPVTSPRSPRFCAGITDGRHATPPSCRHIPAASSPAPHALQTLTLASARAINTLSSHSPHHPKPPGATSQAATVSS